MAVLTIVPLATPKSVTSQAKARVLSAQRLFLETAEHPCAQFVLDAMLDYTAMDDLYESSADFDELNAAIAARLMCGEDAVYAVPGRGVGAAQLSAITAAAAEAGMRVELLPSSGYAEAALCAAGLSPAGAAIFSAYELPCSFDVLRMLCIEEIDTPVCAGDIKLALGEFYPDSHTVSLCSMEENGTYSVKRLPLFKLDRQAGYFAATTLLVPPVEFLALSRYGLDGLMTVLARLRAPGGCPWDAKQTHGTLKTALIEEAYEVIDAIENDDDGALCEELGDLLLQIGTHTRIAEEQSAFTMRDVTTGIVSKLIYRHPHVFGDGHVSGADEVLVNWEKLKKVEKHFKSQSDVLRAVPKSFPALTRSAKVQKKAADVGFDWENAKEAFFKIGEETEELSEAVESGSAEEIDEELGDLLFAVVNVARLLKHDPELALCTAADKFVSRFSRMEELILSDGRAFEGMTLAEMDGYWDRAKAEMAGTPLSGPR